MQIRMCIFCELKRQICGHVLHMQWCLNIGIAFGRAVREHMLCMLRAVCNMMGCKLVFVHPFDGKSWFRWMSDWKGYSYLYAVKF